MHFGKFAFGTIQIDGGTCEHDVVIESRGDPQAEEKAIQALS